jgi:hypothetical protein
LQNILQYITKDRDTYTYITEIEKNLGECNGKINDAGLTIQPAFQYSGISFSQHHEKCEKKKQREALNFNF